MCSVANATLMMNMLISVMMGIGRSFLLFVLDMMIAYHILCFKDVVFQREVIKGMSVLYIDLSLQN